MAKPYDFVDEMRREAAARKAQAVADRAFEAQVAEMARTRLAADSSVPPHQFGSPSSIFPTPDMVPFRTPGGLPARVTALPADHQLRAMPEMLAGAGAPGPSPGRGAIGGSLYSEPPLPTARPAQEVSGPLEWVRDTADGVWRKRPAAPPMNLGPPGDWVRSTDGSWSRYSQSKPPSAPTPAGRYRDPFTVGTNDPAAIKAAVLDEFYGANRPQGARGVFDFSMRDAFRDGAQQAADDRQYFPSPSAIRRDAMVARESALTRAMDARASRDGLRFGSDRVLGGSAPSNDQVDQAMATVQGNRAARDARGPRDLGNPALADQVRQDRKAAFNQRQENAGAIARVRRRIVPWDQDQQFLSALQRNPAAMAALISQNGQTLRDQFALGLQRDQLAAGLASGAADRSLQRELAADKNRTTLEAAKFGKDGAGTSPNDRWGAMKSKVYLDAGGGEAGLKAIRDLEQADPLGIGRASGQPGAASRAASIDELVSGDMTDAVLDKLISDNPSLFTPEKITAGLWDYAPRWNGGIFESGPEAARRSQVRKAFERAAILRGINKPLAAVPSPNSDGGLTRMGAPMGR